MPKLVPLKGILARINGIRTLLPVGVPHDFSAEEAADRRKNFPDTVREMIKEAPVEVAAEAEHAPARRAPRSKSADESEL